MAKADRRASVFEERLVLSMRDRFTTALAAVGALSLLILSTSMGCSDKAQAAAPACFDAGIDPACTPAYEPSWDALYATTFRPTCAVGNHSCHASTGRQDGIDFSNADTAYANVMNGKVVAGKPECSILVERMISKDAFVRMPPARSLSDGEQCAIFQWIAAGAHR